MPEWFPHPYTGTLVGMLLALAELPRSQWSVEFCCQHLASFLLPRAAISYDVRGYTYYPVNGISTVPLL